MRVLDFSNFRTQGLRRTIGQGMDARFVTPAKLLALITSAEGLVAFGACETMDSALSVEVLEALLFRDGEWSKPSSVRGVSIERRGPRTHKMLESLDLCNCVSPRFAEALAKFVEQHLNKFSNRVTETVLEETESEDSEDDERGRSRRTARGSGSRAHTQQQRSVSIHRDDNLPSKHPALPTRFPSLRRLGLAGITFGTELLNPFVLAFPRLTHLDLSGTKASASLLNALGSSSTVQLESLSLARCRRLDSESITEFLVDSPVTANITELSLEGTLIFPTPLTPEDLKTIITSAPCFRAGQLRYLDLGGCLLTDEHLDALTPQPALLDLGLASCPRISLQAVSKTLRERAPNVQILELTDSCTATPANIPALTSNSSPHRAGAIGVMQLQSVLLGPCSSVPPPPLSQQLALLGLGSAGSSTSPTRQTDGNGFAISPPRPPTNLRVVGLSAPTLRSVRGGLGTWRSIWGAGQRGWIVDTAAGALPTMQSTSSSSSSDPDSTPSAQGQTSRFPSAPGSHSHSVSPHATISSPSVRRAASSASASSRSRSRAPPMPPAPSGPRDEVVRDLPPGHPRRQALEALARAEGHVPGNTGWHSKKMEVLFGFGLLGRESGSYALLSYQM